MERTLSVEEKIKRAEEIYARRQEGAQRKTATVTVNNENRKDIKLLKKMIIQIIVSLLIYIVVYIIQNNNYIFSEEFLKKANEILSYDMNFAQIYENTKLNIENGINQIRNKAQGITDNSVNTLNTENTNSTENIENNSESIIENAIGGAEENTNATTTQLSQEEQDISNIKQTTTFIKPLEGTISSKFGQRDPTTNTVPKNHTGVDIAANMGTKILASTGGEVVISSEEGDFGKHLKIQIGDVSVVYAHCNNLYVKQGDQVTQGQEIAEVGSTGNSTGPHLHFEIRYSERTVDPEKILEL